MHMMRNLSLQRLPCSPPAPQPMSPVRRKIGLGGTPPRWPTMLSLERGIPPAAEQAGGRAVGADVSQREGGTRIAVEVASPQGVKTVFVGA